MATTSALTVRVPAKLNRRLEKLAARTSSSKSQLAAEAIARYLEHRERQIAQIREGLADAKAGRVIPHEDVEAWLKSWGQPGERPPECE